MSYFCFLFRKDRNFLFFRIDENKGFNQGICEMLIFSNLALTKTHSIIRRWSHSSGNLNNTLTISVYNIENMSAGKLDTQQTSSIDIKIMGPLSDFIFLFNWWPLATDSFMYCAGSYFSYHLVVLIKFPFLFIFVVMLLLLNWYTISIDVQCQRYTINHLKCHQFSYWEVYVLCPYGQHHLKHSLQNDGGTFLSMGAQFL